MAKKVNINWGLLLVLQIFFGAITGGVMRILKGHIITGGFFAIGWIVVIISLIVNKDYKWLWAN